MSRLDTFDMSSESRRSLSAVLLPHGGWRTSYSAHLYKFGRFYALTCTSYLFRKMKNINLMYTPINLHIITLYKLHNELSCVSSQSSSSCRVCRAVLLDKLDTGKMHGLDMSNVSSRVVSRCDEPSGIWALRETELLVTASFLTPTYVPR